MNYYNDNDPKVCAWLRELIAAGELPDGHVDGRSILDVKPDELAGYDQCHFFAGVGGWNLALRWAGLEGVPGIWTGSCPCQPLSCAGKRQGEKDERHLWPAFCALIAVCHPATVFGEQVASKDGREWFAGIRLDLEGMGYACGGADLCAAGIGAPHRRQRIYWVADRIGAGLEGYAGDEQYGCESGRHGAVAAGPASEGGEPGGLADAENSIRRPTGEKDNSRRRVEKTGGRCEPGCMGDPSRRGCGERRDAAQPGGCGYPDGTGWAKYDLILCRDGKARRVESGTFPLVARLPRGVVPGGDPSVSEAQASAEARVMRLRGYGNAIVPQLAAEFVLAFMETAKE
jgi:DNA (cytosine-5)-methyltransferase 1